MVFGFVLKAVQVRQELNKWASDHTNGLIIDLLPRGSVKSETVQSSTKDNEFHQGKEVHVPFMRSYESQYIMACDGFKVLGLPYQQGLDDTKRKFSIYFYLPD
ncbi:putative Serpin family protein [Arabidopsis thaliana]